MVSLKEVAIEDSEFLYDLLKERTDLTNFNNNKMPSLDEHIKFIKSNHYQKWYIIIDNGKKIGSINLDKGNGIGTFILKKYQKKGYGSKSIEEIIKINSKSKYYANINPENQNSINLYKKMGFKHVYDHYELRT